jgi:acetyl esterase/lipase
VTEARDILTRPAPPPTRTLRYGPHPDHVTDLWLPPRPAAPLVVFLHGGFWRSEYDRTHTAPLAAALATAGYAVTTPEYRRTHPLPAAESAGGGVGAGGQGAGGWPETFLDVAAVLDALPELLPAGEVDLDRVVYAGHSAGGHLALWAALRHRIPPGAPGHRPTAPPVRGVLALAPVADLTAARDLDAGAVDALLHGSPETVPDRYAAADPSLLPAPDVPVTLLHGTADQRVPIALSRTYAARTGAHLIELPNTDHFALIDPLLPPWHHVRTTLATLTAQPAPPAD